MSNSQTEIWFVSQSPKQAIKPQFPIIHEVYLAPQMSQIGCIHTLKKVSMFEAYP